MAMNFVTICGRLVSDPQLSQTKTGKAYCRFTLAVDKPGKDAGANFLNCVAWEKRGEAIAKYVKKGDKFLVTGRLDQSSYEKDGQKQSFVSVVVDGFEFMEGKKKEATPSEQVGFDFSQAEEEPVTSELPF